jgi:hypothetical protein
MYDIDKILYGIRNPRRVLWELGWIYHRRVRGKRGIRIMDADWDNLIILDACRYDLFREVNTIEGELSTVISKGSSTAEFLHRNFKIDERTYGESVYISANPQNQKHSVKQYFHDSIPVWETEWDDNLRTVHPSDLTEQAVKISDQYPNKRLIVHYIQPHYPFIGETGREIEHRSLHGFGALSDPEKVPPSVWTRLKNDEEVREHVWTAYQENLELTLPHIEQLIEELEGKTVVTSDHGNALGRFGLYGHPSKRFLKELVKVPWLEIDSNTRKTIKVGEIGGETEAGETVNERLAHLGYK